MQQLENKKKERGVDRSTEFRLPLVQNLVAMEQLKKKRLIG
jgi:hypothetical protein